MIIHGGIWGFSLLLMVIGWVVGRELERRHFRQLREREQKLRHFRCTTTGPERGANVREARLVQGSVVVSLDYFKSFAASLKTLFGGRLRAYEPLMERARREAVLRMTEQAFARGFEQVVGVRIETARLASKASNGQGTSGVEVLAFGTALKLVERAGGQQLA